MDHFSYRSGVLSAEETPLPEIARAVGTPFYCYSTATLARHFHVMRDALTGLDHMVAFAVKANGNIAVIASLAKLGAGADIVSEGELRRALRAGVPGARIVFSGVGKTVREIEAALAAEVGQFNVESAPELEMISAVAARRGAVAPVALRVNPDVDARTHAKISTGKRENKFGVPIQDAPALYSRAAELPGVRVVGVDMHIGSQLTEIAPFAAAFARMADLIRALRAAGHDITRADIGGGLGIPYRRAHQPAPPLPFDYGGVVRDAFGDLDVTVIAEPGRMLAGNAGVLVTEVLFVKDGPERRFVVVDAGMNDLARPAMYEAWHDIEPVTEPVEGAPTAPQDVVGPVCESSDVFAAQRPLPPLAQGDLIAIRSAGAYGATMASEYNSRLLIPEVLVHGARFEVVRARPSYDDMLRRERLASWQEPGSRS